MAKTQKRARQSATARRAETASGQPAKPNAAKSKRAKHKGAEPRVKANAAKPRPPRAPLARTPAGVGLRRSSAGVAASAQEIVGVTMTIDFGSNPPADVMSIRRIDGEPRPSGQAAVNHGTHTARWDLVSPTIRPIAFAVTITEDATGKKLLNRSQQKTGFDGKGAGVGTFTV